ELDGPDRLVGLPPGPHARAARAVGRLLVRRPRARRADPPRGGSRRVARLPDGDGRRRPRAHGDLPDLPRHPRRAPQPRGDHDALVRAARAQGRGHALSVAAALGVLALVDCMLAGFRAAAGRDGRLRKARYYVGAVARAAAWA